MCVLSLFTLFSCGKNKYEKIALKYYDEACDELKELKSPLVGDYFVIKKATLIAGKTSQSEMNEELHKKKKSGSRNKVTEEDMKAVGEIIYVSKLIDSIGEARMEDCMKSIENKEIPCKYDSQYYSSLKTFLMFNGLKSLMINISFKAPNGVYSLPIKYMDENGVQIYSSTIPLKDIRLDDDVYTARISYPYFKGDESKIASIELGNPMQATFILRRRALGPISIRQQIAGVQSSVPGLYTEMERKKDTYYDMDEEVTEEYVYFKLDGKVMFRAYMDGSAISVLTACKGAGEIIKTEQGLYAGCPIGDLFRMGKTLRWNYYFDGFVLAEDDDFVYRISDEYLTAESENAVNYGLKESHFKKGAVIDNISTKR